MVDRLVDLEVDSDSEVLVPVLSEIPEEGSSCPNMPSTPDSRKGPPAANNKPDNPAIPAPFNALPALLLFSITVPKAPLLDVIPFVSDVLFEELVEVLSLSDFDTDSEVPVLVLR